MPTSPTPPTDLPPLRDVIARYGLSSKRFLGQHFLLDLNLCRRIARTAGDLSDATVIEIGPGPGGLTRALLETDAPRIVAVEYDRRCVEALKELVDAYPGRLEVIEGDALHMDLSALGPAPRRVVANLPYNIATPLLIGWLRKIDDFKGFTLMFQKEVADRLAATPRTKDYGRLSLLVQWLCRVEPQFNIDRRAFTPAPKVASTVVNLIPRSEPLAAANWSAFEKITATAFGQRRKMLRASLKPLQLDLHSLGIDPRRRAEELSVEEICALARALESRL